MRYNVIIFTDTTDNIASVPSIGPFKCAHVLRKHGYSCLVVNYLSDFTKDELVHLSNQIIDTTTCLVGFSNTFMRSVEIGRDPSKPTPVYPDLNGDIVFPQGKDFENYIISHIKKINPNIKFVVGGVKTHQGYNNQNINYACLGYSESSIVNLVNHLVYNEPLKKCTKNIWGVQVIDDRLAPDYKFAFEDMQWEPTDVINQRCLPIEIGRGCIFKCKFCAYPMNGKEVLDFVKSAENLREELQHNYNNYRIKNYTIVDDTFNDHPQKLDMIHDVVKSLTFQPNFWAYTRLDLLHTRPNTVEKLYEIGLRSCYFGIETIHPKAGRAIGKGYDFEKSIETIRYIRRNYPDMVMHGSFIIGLPHESIDHVILTNERLVSQDIPLHSWKFSPLIIEETKFKSFNSDISLNYPKYGYTKMGVVNNRWIDWQNSYMTFQQAKDLSEKFNNQGLLLDCFKVTGLAHSLSTMGLNVDWLFSTAFRDLDFHYIEYSLRPKFILEYKKKLIEMVTH